MSTDLTHPEKGTPAGSISTTTTLKEENKMEEMRRMEEANEAVEKHEGKLSNEKGLAIIEILIILAILVALAAIFRDQISAFAQRLFGEILAFDATMG